MTSNEWLLILFLVLVERRDSYLFSSTKSIKEGGSIRRLYCKNLGSGGTTPLLSVEVLKKLAQVDEGKVLAMNDITNRIGINSNNVVQTQSLANQSNQVQRDGKLRY